MNTTSLQDFRYFKDIMLLVPVPDYQDHPLSAGGSNPSSR